MIKSDKCVKMNKQHLIISMKSRTKFGLKTEEYFSVFNSFYEDFHIDFSVYLLYNSKKLDFNNLSILNKIQCNFMNSEYFQNIFGSEAYKLVNFNDKFLVVRSMKDNTNLHYQFSEGQLVNCPQSIITAKSNLEEKIEDLMDDPSFKSYNEKIKFRDSFKEIVSHKLNDKENKILIDFLKEFPEYEFFNKKDTVKSFLTTKIKNNDVNIITIKNNDFIDHYSRVKTIFPFDFYNEYTDPSNEFKKIKMFLSNDLGLNYFYDTENIIDNDIWFSFEKNNSYIGGGLVHSNEYATIIESVAIFNKEHNNINIKKIFKDILNNEDISKDIIFKPKHLFKDITDKEIRKLYKEKRLYLNKSEIELFLDISYFIDVHKLSDKKEEILNDFYQNIILGNQKLLNSESIDYNILKLNNVIKDKHYSELSLVSNTINRNDFINVCIFLNHKEDINSHIEKNKTDFNFSIEVNEFNNREIPAVKIQDLLNVMGLNLKKENYEKLIENINDIGSFIAYHKHNSEIQIFELDYHKLYDFLLDNNVLDKGNKIKVYRIEDKEDIGLYISKNTSIKDSNLYNYSNRKLPKNERKLTQIFKNNRDKTGYHSKYFFGFSDKKQIENWFHDDIKDIIKNNNIKLVEYEIHSNYAVLTKLQVAFDKSKSAFVKNIDINEFLNDFKNSKKLVNSI